MSVQYTYVVVQLGKDCFRRRPHLGIFPKVIKKVNLFNVHGVWMKIVGLVTSLGTHKKSSTASTTSTFLRLTSV